MLAEREKEREIRRSTSGSGKSGKDRKKRDNKIKSGLSDSSDGDVNGAGDDDDSVGREGLSVGSGREGDLSSSQGSTGRRRKQSKITAALQGEGGSPHDVS